jgi:hypothetical protein
MRDVGYVAAGYAVALVMLGAYRWRLAVRTRRARRYLSTATGRTGPATGRTGAGWR